MDLLKTKHIFHKKKSGLASGLQIRFLNRLIRLLEKGYSLVDSLLIIEWDKQLKFTSQKINHDLQRGYYIDESLERNGFSHAITNYLYVVRTNGNLHENLSKCIQMYEQRMEYTKKFKQTARYPLILFFIFLVLLFFIKQSVMPSFTDLFQGNVEASAMISVSVFVINGFTLFLVLFAATMLIIYVLSKYYRKYVAIEKQIYVYSKIPILRQYLKLQTSFLFATHVSSLLKTGLSLRDILENIQHQKRLQIVSYYASLMISELSNGKQISGLLSGLKLMDKQLSVIFEKNTDARALEKDLTTYAELSTELLNRKITKAITFIQPIFFVILACFIIFIYLSLMWPMFQLLKTI
ncbi:MAG TPA: competence type IV pilus assembly protein ComGB [Bacillota bacterium]|nr:competence type IV pilus assembly protein ComGB [Bacillota bacterium]